MTYSTKASKTVDDFILTKIQDGVWIPGSKIYTEEQICDELGVSRIAVRQALGRLSALSVLTKQQGSGTYVNKFEDASLAGMVYYPATVERFLTVLEFRKQFDAYNAELYAKNASDEEIKKLEENYVEMVDSVSDSIKFQRLENDFHQMIADGTHNAIVHQISVTMTELLIRYQMLQYDNIGPDNSIKWHERILEALKLRDAEMAKLCVKIHLENSIQYLKNKPENSIHLK